MLTSGQMLSRLAQVGTYAHALGGTGDHQFSGEPPVGPWVFTALNLGANSKYRHCGHLHNVALFKTAASMAIPCIISL